MTDNRSGDRLQFGHRFIDRLDLRASTGGDRGPAFRENRFQQSRLTTKVLHQLRFAGAGSTRDGRSTSMFVPPIGEEFLSDAQNATVCVHRRSRKSAVNLVQHSGSIHLAAHGRNNYLFKGGTSAIMATNLRPERIQPTEAVPGTIALLAPETSSADP